MSTKCFLIDLRYTPCNVLASRIVLEGETFDN